MATTSLPSIRLLVAVAALISLASACTPTRTENSALLPAGALAAELSERLDASRLAENSPAELIALLNDAVSTLPAGPTATPEPSFPYLITVASGDHAACVAPDFSAIATKTPGPLTFSVTAGACRLDDFEAGFAEILDARRG
jgi:hypothetical protein